MNLYNVLSINGIDIDEYLGGGGSEEINEKIINMNNILTYNMPNFKNNIRYFDSNCTSILNNYIINNCSDIYHEFIEHDILLNSTILYDEITKYINAFKLDSNVDMCIFNNFNFTFFLYYQLYTSISEYDLNFEYKTLIISKNDYKPISCSEYLINTSYTLDNIKIYKKYSHIDTKAHYYNEHILEGCNALSFNIICNIYNSGNITFNPAINNLNVLNSCSILINCNDNFVCDYAFSDCSFGTLYFVCSETYYGGINNIHIYRMFNNCTIGDLYLFNSYSYISVDTFIDDTNKINNIYVYVYTDTSRTSDYINIYKLTGNLTSLIKTFTTYNIMDHVHV